ERTASTPDDSADTARGGGPTSPPIRVGLIGVGKMGISHCAILGAHPRVAIAGICDSATYMASALRKHTGTDTFHDYRKMIDSAGLDCVFVATPTSTHFDAATCAQERCLHDYASHVVDLMNFIVGPPERVLGAHLRRIYSKDVEDAVYATFRYPGGASGQLETNWSDNSYRKMSTTMAVYGTRGKIVADR